MTDRLRPLCRLDDLPDGAAKGFGPPAGGFTGLRLEHLRTLAGLDSLSDTVVNREVQVSALDPDAGSPSVEVLLHAIIAKPYVDVNSCPHLGVPLDWVPDRFLSPSGDRIVCATHGAEFRVTDGQCTHGPCLGDRLEPVMIEIKAGVIFVPKDAGV